MFLPVIVVINYKLITNYKSQINYKLAIASLTAIFVMPISRRREKYRAEANQDLAFETMRSLKAKKRASPYEEKLATLSNFNLRGDAAR